MELDPDLLESARKGNSAATVQLLALYYPVIWRMSTGLTGRDDVGRGVVKYMMQRSLRILPNWKDEGAPTRWFHHHTILTIRRTQKHQPDPQQDTLLGHGADRGYVAFIKALRALPIQQREAFILNHGEKMKMRDIAVAMDCSVEAAENHLKEASDRLKPLTADAYDGYIRRLNETYQKLAPNEEMAIRDVRPRVRAFFLSRFLGKLIRFFVAIGLLAGASWAGYWIWRIVNHSMNE